MTGPLTRSEARKLHITSHDDEADFTTVELSDFKLSRAPHLHDGIQVVEIVRQVMLLLSPVLLSECCPDWEKCVTIAGSAPMAILENILKYSVTGELRGRWASKETPTWGCNDVDVFVSGPDAACDNAFRSYTAKFTDRLKVASKDMGFPVVRRRRYKHRYILHDRLVNIVQYEFSELCVSLQLIQAPTDQNAGAVVKRFDINTVQVMLNPCTGLIHAPLDSVRNVEMGMLDLNLDACWPPRGDTEFELRKGLSTAERIEKYKRRGYGFHATIFLLCL